MAEALQQPTAAPGGAAAGDAAAFLLHWVATLFAAAPTALQIEAYRSGPGAELLAALGDDPGLEPAVSAMRVALSRAPDAAAAADDIRMAFNLLFQGLDGPETVAPYQSAHTSPRGLLFQKPTTQMEELLGELGMIATGLPAEPADHLSIQLEILAELIRRGEEERRRALVEDQLRGWIPGFCRMVIERDRQGFYAGAAALLDVLIQRQTAQPITADHSLH